MTNKVKKHHCLTAFLLSWLLMFIFCINTFHEERVVVPGKVLYSEIYDKWHAGKKKTETCYDVYVKLNYKGEKVVKIENRDIALNINDYKDKTYDIEVFSLMFLDSIYNANYYFK